MSEDPAAAAAVAVDDQPDPAHVRAVLREHGYAVPARGKIGAEHMDAYQAILEAGPGDYDSGVTAADFPPDDPEPGEPAGPAAPPARRRGGQRPPAGPGRSERRPARPRPPTMSARLSGWWRKSQAGGGGAKSRPRKPKRERVSVERIGAHVWDFLARLTKDLDPPVSRCLHFQSDMAGIVIEDLVKDTIADGPLQVAARFEAKGRKVFALVVPPMAVAALEQAQGLPPDQRAIREAILLPILREAMVTWVEVAGEHIEEKLARDRELGPIYARVDEMLAEIFAPVTAAPPTAADAAAAAEDQAAAAAQMAGMPG